MTIKNEVKKKSDPTDGIQDSLLSIIVSHVEALPEFAKSLELDASLAKLDEFEAVKKSQLEDIVSSLVGLREKLANSDPIELEELSKEHARLANLQTEITSFLPDLDKQREVIIKDKTLMKQAISKQAQAILQKLWRQENQEITALVAIIEKRLQTWNDTVNKAHVKYFREMGPEMSSVMASVRVYAPMLQKSCSIVPV